MSADVRALGRGVVVRYTGTVSAEGVFAAVDALAAHEAFGPDVPTLWDFSATAGVGLHADQMRQLALRVSTLRDGADSPRLGLLMSGDAEFGSARMFVGMNESRLPHHFRVFRDSTEAYDWTLDVDPAPVPDAEAQDG